MFATVAAIGAWLIGGLIATSTGSAAVTVTTSLLGLALILATASWAGMALARAWSMAVRGSPINLQQSMDFVGYPTFLLIVFLITPVMFLAGPLAFGFGATALLLAAGDRMPATAAIGRMLSETCGSSRRFFHNLLIGAIAALAFLTITVLSSYITLQASAGAFSSSIQSSFGDDNSLRNADAGLTVIVGFGIAGILTIVLSFVIWNVLGLWVAARLRHLMGRPVGERVTSHSQLMDVPE